MKYIMLFITMVYIFDILVNYIKLYIIRKRTSGETEYDPHQKNQKLYILIPMMDEQKIAEETFEHFYQYVEKGSHYKLVFITTDREKRCHAVRHTYDILSEVIGKYHSANTILYHYSGSGVMAHQLNYAVAEIDKIEKDNYWIAVYNADSRISRESLAYFEERAVGYREPGNEFCMQQYSYFAVPRGIKEESVLASAALWQNRWSILFEYARAKYHVELWKGMSGCSERIQYLGDLLFGKMNYVIGHGLFINRGTLKKVGGFPEKTLNEDAFLGYLLCENKVTIHPIPYFECAEFTDAVSKYIKQQTVWFNGPFDAFVYYKLWKKMFSSDITIGRKIRAFLLAFKLFLHAVYWLLSPVVLLVVLPVYYVGNYKIYGFAASLLMICLLLYVTNLLVYRLLREKFPGVLFPRPSFLYDILFYMVHCIGPLRNIILRILRKNSMENKYKTERN